MIDVSTLTYADTDRVTDMSHKIHGIVFALEAEAERWAAFRNHLTECRETSDARIHFGPCPTTCPATRAELAKTPEYAAYHNDLLAAWRGHYAHNHETSIIRWADYNEITNRLAETIATTRAEARRMLIEDAELTERTFTVMQDACVDLGGLTLDNPALRDDLMAKSREAYDAWRAQHGALIQLVSQDDFLRYLVRPTANDTGIRLLMTMARFRRMDADRQHIDDLYNLIVRTVDDERRAEAAARK